MHEDFEEGTMTIKANEQLREKKGLPSMINIVGIKTRDKEFKSI
jgi:hypothetical protein